MRVTFAPLCEDSRAKLAAALAISFMFTGIIVSGAKKRLEQMNHSGISCQNLAYYEVCCTAMRKKKRMCKDMAWKWKRGRV